LDHKFRDKDSYYVTLVNIIHSAELLLPSRVIAMSWYQLSNAVLEFSYYVM